MRMRFAERRAMRAAWQQSDVTTVRATTTIKATRRGKAIGRARSARSSASTQEQTVDTLCESAKSLMEAQADANEDAKRVESAARYMLVLPEDECAALLPSSYGAYTAEQRVTRAAFLGCRCTAKSSLRDMARTAAIYASPRHAPANPIRLNRYVTIIVTPATCFIVAPQTGI